MESCESESWQVGENHRLAESSPLRSLRTFRSNALSNSEQEVPKIFGARMRSMGEASFRSRDPAEPVRDLINKIFDAATMRAVHGRLVLPCTDVSNGNVFVIKSAYLASFVRWCRYCLEHVDPARPTFPVSRMRGGPRRLGPEERESIDSGGKKSLVVSVLHGQ